jgi:hypothetical protein
MLDVVAAWELDAALEAPQRQVLRSKAIARIEAGEASVVVGPRGAGKTAASRFILAESAGRRPAARIAMKDAFMAALRPLADPRQNERASASARYLMLLAAFEAAVSEQLLEGGQIRALASEFAVALEPGLADALPLAFNKAVLYEIFGGSDAIEVKRGELVSRIMTLEHEMANALGGHQAMVLFDETADRSVVAGALDDLRLDALSVLLRGVGDLIRGPTRDRIAPVIFTRPGLFARLPQAERQRWRKRTLELAWSSRELQTLAGYRLARAADRNAASKAADGAFQAFFSEASRAFGGGASAVWRFIWPRTRARPRDVVFFIRAAARNARHRALDHVDAEALLQAEKTYSAYLLQDMADEIRDVAPEVDDVMAALARHGKMRMSAPELVDVIERALGDPGSVEAVAPARVAIERLFAASAIGNWTGHGRNGRARFIYDDPAATLDTAEPVMIHPGLAEALDLDLEAAA